ncbi:MerR family transcriptional regulator [Streptosporangium carneum]|uniref:MerR family transcriptional regulator n=1 Tax=Streptosporangium carneum TaxID=47481 RepID=A0A9W6HYV7_9ACTN|nr:MerR family transcriptional regulator [Streptosporangium carneum]GLK08174.1 MerR family transcriptional regulator [Streptosporangium carneum]
MDEQGRATTEEEAGYGIGAVARRLGVPAPTLRTWNLRYGIGPSRRSPGGHRRYDADDLRRLEEMNRLIKAGVPAADAARQVLRIRAVPPPAEAGPPPAVPAPAPPPALALPARAEIPTVAMLARAAIALDSQTVSEWIGVALSRHGVIWTWENLVLPVFDTICRRQAETGASVEVEHVFSDRVLAALAPLVRRPARPVNDRPVLLACAEDEQHCLPIYALAAVLTIDHHVETRVLGARTPYSALGDAMRRLGPAVVFVWSQRPETGDPAPLLSLPLLRPPSRLVVGGVGWRDDLPASVTRVASFSEALSRIGAALR